MNETCEICGTPLTIQNSEAFAERQQVRMRHVPGNCTQVLYARLTRFMLSSTGIGSGTLSPADYRPGMRVWYEPSAGVRFLGETVDDAPRKLGDTWVTALAMVSRAYGDWRRAGKVSDADVRMSVPAAALDALHPARDLPIRDIIAYLGGLALGGPWPDDFPANGMHKEAAHVLAMAIDKRWARP